MKSKFYSILFVILSFATSLCAQNAENEEKKEIIKKGYNFGPLPAVAFDADKGFQLGALLNIYDFGDGSTYPNTRQQWYFEASFFTKGSQLFVISYDTKYLIPGIRFSTALAVTNDNAMDFYGFNGYRSFYDFDKVKAGKEGTSFIYTPYYRTKRLAALFKADFIGNLWNNKLFWEAGYHLSYFDQGAINRTKINKNKDENEIFPSNPDSPAGYVETLYEQYCKWGIIPDDQMDGGVNSTVRLGLLYDTRDKEGAPSKGIWAEAHVTLAPKFLGTTHPYSKYSATFRHYIPVVKNDILTFAYRLNYQGTFGTNAPYYVLPYITTMGQSYDRDGMGGFRTIRGIMRNRVQGLDMASYNAEARWRFVSFTLWKQNISLGLNCFSDGTMVTKEYDMSFGRSINDFESEDAYNRAKEEYNTYMSYGLKSDRPHITVGGGFRFIMNQNFIVCLEYGKPVGKYGKQDGNGAFYINTGYLF